MVGKTHFYNCGPISGPKRSPTMIVNALDTKFHTSHPKPQKPSRPARSSRGPQGAAPREARSPRAQPLRIPRWSGVPTLRLILVTAFRPLNTKCLSCRRAAPFRFPLGRTDGRAGERGSHFLLIVFVFSLFWGKLFCASTGPGRCCCHTARISFIPHGVVYIYVDIFYIFYILI